MTDAAVKFLAGEYKVSEKRVRACLKQTAKKHKLTQKKVEEILLRLEAGKWESLPDEILLDIMEKMDYVTLTMFCSISKRMRRICEDEKFWKKKFEEDFPDIFFQTDIQTNRIQTWKEIYQNFASEPLWEKKFKKDFPNSKKLYGRTWEASHNLFKGSKRRRKGLRKKGIKLLTNFNIEGYYPRSWGHEIIGYGPFLIKYQQYRKGPGVTEDWDFYDEAYGEAPYGPITLGQMRDILAKLYGEIAGPNPDNLPNTVDSVKKEGKYWVFDHGWAQWIEEDEEEDW